MNHLGRINTRVLASDCLHPADLARSEGASEGGGLGQRLPRAQPRVHQQPRAAPVLRAWWLIELNFDKDKLLNGHGIVMLISLIASI